CRVLMCCASTLPASTARAQAATRANEAAANTSQALFARLAANSTVASCVLSPSSARKTVPKIARRVLRSMDVLRGWRDLITLTTPAQSPSRRLSIRFEIRIAGELELVEPAQGLALLERQPAFAHRALAVARELRVQPVDVVAHVLQHF